MRKQTAFRSLWLLLLLQLFSASLWANGDKKLAYLRIVSEESDTVSGFIDVQLNLKAYDSVTVVSAIAAALPDSWSVSIAPAPDSFFARGDSVIRTIRLQYPTASLPFYPVKIKFGMKLHSTQDSLAYDSTTAPLHVYFTPYGTVELMDAEEYNSDRREWLIPDSIHPQRIYVHRDSIPVSNIPDTFQVREEWQQNTQLLFVEGLAYAVPMMPIHPDSLLPDTSVYWEMPYTVTMRGRCVAEFTNGIVNPPWRDRPLEGLRVELWTTGGRWSPFGTGGNLIGVGTTDAEGRYEIFINNANLRGSTRGVYIRVKAENRLYDISATHKWSKISYSRSRGNITLNTGPNNVIIDEGDMRLDDDAFRAVHIAGKCYNFVRNNSPGGFTLPNTLRIYPHTNIVSTAFYPDKVGGVTFAGVAAAAGAIYLPVGVLTFAAGLKQPTIVLNDGDGEDEYVPAHEFGHFLMWHLQGRDWIHIISGGFAFHDPRGEANTQIAWTEGWADGFAQMVDRSYADNDGEALFDDWRWNHENENTDILTPTANGWVNNGVRSEHFISCALYDLWDGASVTPSDATIDAFTTSETLPDITPTDVDAGPGNDNVSIPFAAICALVRATPKIENIQEFYMRLLASRNCEERRDIRDVFDNNHIQWDITNIWGQRAGFSTDEIRAGRTVVNRGAFPPFSINQMVDVGIIGPWTSYNLCVDPSLMTQTKTLSDNLLVTNDRSLFINNFIAPGWVDPANADRPAVGSTLNAELCGPMTLTIENNGSLVIGDALTDLNASLTVRSGSTLIIGDPGGGGLACSLIVNRLGSLIIEDEATLVIHPNARIILNGDQAQIIIRGTLRIEPNAEFTYQGANLGSGFVRFEGRANLQNNIDAGTGSSFLLDGAGPLDKVLEVGPNTLLNSGGVETFSLIDGNAVMGAGSMLSLYTEVNMNNFHLIGVANGRFEGVQFFGQMDASGFSRIHLENVEIEECENCIHAPMLPPGANPLYNGAPIWLRNVRLHHHTNSGLYSRGNGIAIEGLTTTGSRFAGMTHGDNVGWDADFMTYSEAKRTLFKENAVNGIQFKSQRSMLFMEQCFVRDNPTDVMTENSLLFSTCSYITNPSPGTTDDPSATTMRRGIYAFDSDVHLDAGTGTGRTMIDTQHVCLGLAGDAFFYLDNGENHFLHNGCPSCYDVEARLWTAPSSSPTYTANKNYWTNQTPPPPTPTYVIDYQIPWGTTGVLVDFFPKTTYPVNLSSPGFEWGSCNYSGPPLSVLPDSLKITLRYQPLNPDDYMRLRQATYLTRNYPIQAVDYLAGILSDASRSTDTLYLNECVKLAMEAVHGGIERRALYPSDSQGLPTERTRKLMNALRALEPKTVSNLTAYGFRKQVMESLAGLNHLAGQREDALAAVRTMLAWTVDEDYNTAVSRTCYLENEVLFRQGKINGLEFAKNTRQCESEMHREVPNRIRPKKPQQTQALAADMLTVHPNPTRQSITAVVAATATGVPIFTLLDGSGRIYALHQTSATEQGGAKSYTFDVNGLPVGIYYLQSTTTSGVKRQKFAVVK